MPIMAHCKLSATSKNCYICGSEHNKSKEQTNRQAEIHVAHV